LKEEEEPFWVPQFLKEPFPKFPEPKCVIFNNLKIVFHYKQPFVQWKGYVAVKSSSRNRQ